MSDTGTTAPATEEKKDSQNLGKGEIVGLLVFVGGFFVGWSGLWRSGLGFLAFFALTYGGLIMAVKATAKKKGKKSSFVMTYLATLLGFVAVLIVAAVHGESRTETSAPAQTAAAAPAAPAPAAAVPPTAAPPPATSDATADELPRRAGPKIGETVTFKDSIWTVVSAKLAGKTLRAKSEFLEPAHSEDGKFVIVRFKVKNLTKSEERIIDHPKLRDAQGREFETFDGQDSYIPNGAKTMMMEALPSTMTREFWAIYEVPADATGLKFVTRSLSISPNLVPVDLGI